jgi:hypothetical protein
MQLIPESHSTLLSKEIEVSDLNSRWNFIAQDGHCFVRRHFKSVVGIQTMDTSLEGSFGNASKLII